MVHSMKMIFQMTGQELYIHIQTESCDEYDGHSPFDWICGNRLY